MEELDELLGNAGFGALDNIQLEESEAYNDYFLYLKKACKVLNEHLIDSEKKSGQALQFKRVVISHYLGRLLRTLDLIRLKYRYDPHHKVRIDSTDSSFPNHAELRQVKADFNLKETFLKDLPSSLELKDKLIDHLRKKEDEPKKILDKLGKRSYFEKLELKSLYLQFNAGNLIDQGKDDKTGRRAYIYSWSNYDAATNLPLIYMMEFQYSGTESIRKSPEDLKKFTGAADTIANGTKKINEIARLVDTQLELIHPKKLQKYTVGPLYGEYSQDENPLSLFHHKHKLGLDSFVLEYSEETIESAGEEKADAPWYGENQMIQQWNVNKEDPFCKRAKITSRNRLFFAPHRTMAVLQTDELTAPLYEENRASFIAIS